VLRGQGLTLCVQRILQDIEQHQGERLARDVRGEARARELLKPGGCRGPSFLDQVFEQRVGVELLKELSAHRVLAVLLQHHLDR
jgi:hypothetical protein